MGAFCALVVFMVHFMVHLPLVPDGGGQAPPLQNSRLDKGGYKVGFQISRMRASSRTNRQNHSRRDADIHCSSPSRDGDPLARQD